MHERQGEKAVDLAREVEADQEGYGEGDDRVDEPLPELDQVIEQRRLGGFDLGFVRRGRFRHGAAGVGPSVFSGSAAGCSPVSVSGTGGVEDTGLAANSSGRIDLLRSCSTPESGRLVRRAS